MSGLEGLVADDVAGDAVADTVGARGFLFVALEGTSQRSRPEDLERAMEVREHGQIHTLILRALQAQQPVRTLL